MAGYRLSHSEIQHPPSIGRVTVCIKGACGYVFKHAHHGLHEGICDEVQRRWEENVGNDDSYLMILYDYLNENGYGEYLLPISLVIEQLSISETCTFGENDEITVKRV